MVAVSEDLFLPHDNLVEAIAVFGKKASLYKHWAAYLRSWLALIASSWRSRQLK
jgi:hypothetical protein